MEVDFCSIKLCFSIKSRLCFHAGCHQLLFSPVTSKFLAVNNYTLVVPPVEVRRRIAHITRLLAQRIERQRNWPRKLPSELWHIIAESLVQECATITAQEQAQGCDDPVESILDLNRPVYASYVKMDGYYYVKTLRNGTRAGASGRTCLLLPTQASQEKSNGSSGKDMYVEEDHLGIRRVVFLASNQCERWCRNPPSVPGAWWRHIFWNTYPPTLVVKNDVGNLRS